MRLLLAALILAAASAAVTTAFAAQKAKARNALYGAIAYHQASGAAGWASDRHSSREARVDALKQCGRDDCVIAATVSRDCAALAANARKFSAHKGATQQEAETKALAHCGADCRVVAWVCTR